MTMSAGAELVSLAAPMFDLEATLECGQVFHWQREGAGYAGVIGEQPLYIEQRGEALLVTRGMEETARRYFALDHPLQEIYASFPGDAEMQAALANCRGLRIIRQPLWECLATFITSSMKQVAHIAQISHTLRERFGTAVPFGDRTLHAYPTPAQLAAAGEQALRACGLGYRAPNLQRAAALIASGEVSLEAIATMNDEEARAALCRLPGVGVKVANCALLFAFERVQAFPIDVWIERVLRKTYFARKRKVTAARLREFSATYFGPYGGYAQQYLFHHARKFTPKAPRQPKPKRRTKRRAAARPKVTSTP